MWLCAPDDDADWSVEDRTAAAARARRTQARPLLGVRCRRPAPADGHLHPHRALARLHLVRAQASGRRPDQISQIRFVANCRNMHCISTYITEALIQTPT